MDEDIQILFESTHQNSNGKLNNIGKELDHVPICPSHSDNSANSNSGSKIGNPMTDSCHQMEDAPMDNLKKMLDDDEILNMTLLLENTEGKEKDDALAASVIDSSIISDISEGNADELAPNRPFVPFSVEEISLVKTLDCWSNCNVRIIGTVSMTSEANTNVWSLISIGEEGGPFSVVVNMMLVKEFPLVGAQVQVFGEVQLEGSQPVIHARFFRDLSSVDLFYYNKALEEVKKYVPHFIVDKRKKSLV